MNLDWDVDRDHDMQTEDQQFLLGSSQFQCQNRDMDLVRWQGSQTSSKALNELMQEASKPTRKCKSLSPPCSFEWLYLLG